MTPRRAAEPGPPDRPAGAGAATEGEAPGASPLRSLLRIALAERRLLAPATALALGQAAAALAVPALAGRLAQTLLAGPDGGGASGPGLSSAGSSGGAHGAPVATPSVAADAPVSGAFPGLPDLDAGVAWLAALLAAVVVLHTALGVAAPWLLDRAEMRIARGLRARLHAHLQRVPIAWLESRRSGDLAGVFAVDVEAVALSAGALSASALALGATAFGAFVMMARLDALVAVAALLLVLPVAWTTRRLSGPVAAHAGAFAERHAALLGGVQEGLANALTLRLTGAAAGEAARAEAAEDALAAAREGHLRRRLLAAPTNKAVAGLGLLGLAALALLRPGAPPLAGGELVTLGLYAVVGARPVLGLASLWVHGQQALASLARVETLLAVPGEARPPRPLPAPVRGEVELAGVSLARGGRPVLREVDLRLVPGEVVALVGANGAGKSSLARLLVRLLEPDAGVLRLDGVELAALDPQALRRHVVLASQEIQLFDRSVEANLRLGCEDAPAGAVRDALRRAGALAFVEALPAGLETPVGEGGVRLSGGQRQRLALARALLREPRVLVLDEATSMLDAEGERTFLRENRAWLRKRSVLLVTHRPESLAAVDRVVRLRSGRLLEEPGPRAPRRTAAPPRPSRSRRSVRAPHPAGR